jgi:SAM-dependent methyltransferase
MMEVVNQNVLEFKNRVTAEWAGAQTAAAWQKHYRAMKEQMAHVTNALVDAATPEPGMEVLDLASGTGQPALSLARRVAPAGRVTATDLNEDMLQALRVNARDEGVTNIETRVCDAQELPFPEAAFDLVTSRFGVMFFAETARALSEVRRVLRPGGRIAFLVWGPPVPGSYFGAAAVPVLRRLAVKPDPDGPSPMRFAESGKLVRLVEAAGFTAVTETSLTLPAPFRGSPEELLASLMEIAAPFRNAAATLSESDRGAAMEEAYANLRPLYDGTLTNVTAPVLIVTGLSR